MGLTRQSESNTIFLTAKHYCLWQEIKKKAEGCDVVETHNPQTQQPVTKYGYKFRSISGRAKKLETYNREYNGKRYYGFKLTIADGADLFMVDMPYIGKPARPSQLLQRFMRCAASFDWAKPFSLEVFKGRNQKTSKDETAIWFKQGDETVKSYFTKDNPRGMPAAAQDEFSKEWDFRIQERWLAERLVNTTTFAIADAWASFAPPVEPDRGHAEPEPEPDDDGRDIPPHGEITDDDVPF